MQQTAQCGPMLACDTDRQACHNLECRCWLKSHGLIHRQAANECKLTFPIRVIPQAAVYRIVYYSHVGLRVRQSCLAGEFFAFNSSSSVAGSLRRATVSCTHRQALSPSQNQTPAPISAVGKSHGLRRFERASEAFLEGLAVLLDAFGQRVQHSV